MLRIKLYKLIWLEFVCLTSQQTMNWGA